jgi:hypothetical protein
MRPNDLDSTFAGYAAFITIGALVAIPQIGVVGLFAAGAAIYAGACFMDGFAHPRGPKRR